MPDQIATHDLTSATEHSDPKALERRLAEGNLRLEELTEDQVLALADVIADTNIQRQWLVADISADLIAREMHPATVAQAIAQSPQEVIQSAKIAKDWPKEHREEGVPLFVHDEVHRSLIAPFGGLDAVRAEVADLFTRWKRREFDPRSLRAEIRHQQRAAQQRLQLTLPGTEGEQQDKDVKPPVADDPLGGWQGWFVKTIQGITHIIQTGNPALWLTVDSVKLEMFKATQCTERDRAKTWEILARKAGETLE